MTRYDRSGASSRLRFLQYFTELEKYGFSIRHEPLFSNSYIESLQRNGRASLGISARLLIRRIRYLLNKQRCDAIWIEKEALPWLPAVLEANLLPKQLPLVLDYDDAVFHSYEIHPNPLVRRLLGNKHKVLMRRATLVIAGNQYIADYARSVGASWVELLPTVVDLERYQPRASPYSTGSALPIVGWIGQRSTVSFLHAFAPLFERLYRERLMSFRAIGIDTASLALPMDSEAWSEATEVVSVGQLDVGIMPLDDSAFARGKCGYKLIQYMACGIPVIASPVGVNKTIVEHGVNGFLAGSVEEWETALRTLAKDPALRHSMGQAGRKKVEREYCLQVTIPLIATWLAEVVSRTKV